MKLVNQFQQDDFDARIAQLEAQRPQPIEVERLDPNGEPLTLSNGAIVMPGHYYNSEMGLVIHPDDKAWVKVKG